MQKGTLINLFVVYEMSKTDSKNIIGWHDYEVKAIIHFYFRPTNRFMSLEAYLKDVLFVIMKIIVLLPEE